MNGSQDVVAVLRARAVEMERTVRSRACPAQEDLEALARTGTRDEIVQMRLDHLGRCGHCRRVFDAARRDLPRGHLLGSVGPATARGGLLARAASIGAAILRGALVPSRERAPMFVAVAAVALAALAAWGLVRFREGRMRRELAALAVAAPLEATALREESGSGALEAVRWRGMTAYVDADFERAREWLGRAAALDKSDVESALYLGSSLLLLGRPAEAVAPLERASAVDGDPAAEEAAWQLAQVRLQLGEAAQALDLLGQLAHGGGARAESARALLEKLAPGA